MSLKVTDVLNRLMATVTSVWLKQVLLVSVWLKQVHLAKSLLKLKDFAVVIPLFFYGSAFAISDQLREEEKRDADKLS